MNEGLRQRKGKAKGKSGTSQGPASSSHYDADDSSPASGLWYAQLVLGLGLCLWTGQWFTTYMATMHENHLWFSNIKEVEREISLRTECGLYYSYYKEIVRAPTFAEGIRRLTHDNKTEHGHSINILERFNVYQEVALAWMWRAFGVARDPILFYVAACFALTGAGVSVLFGLSWAMTGRLSSGVLAAAYFTVNLDDATRVFFTVNLREIFAFPFLWIQIAALCFYLRRRPEGKSTAFREMLLRFAMVVFGFLFAITWQFNQFVFLIQACSLIGVGVLQLAPGYKIRSALFLQALSLLGVWAAQFGHPMLLGSLVLSLIPSACLVLSLCQGLSRHARGLIWGVVAILIQLILIAALTILLNIVAKNLLQLEADAHIFKFLKGKFGFGEPRDFDSKVYLCHGAFQFLDNGFWWRTTKTALLPPYGLVLGGVLLVMGRDLLEEWAETNPAKLKLRNPQDPSDKDFFFNRRPDFAFLAIESVVSGVMGIMALRMKYLWTPHIVILASMFLSDSDVVGAMFDFLKIKSRQAVSFVCWVAPLTIAGLLVFSWYPTYQKQMGDLKEFWDPDTVELMEWISNNTAPDASFSGSMQLLAGVKLSTDRHLTNHPHYEDAWLRERTKKVYQMYGRVEPRRVHELLSAEGADYIILEDSICLAPSDGCRTPDLVDLENGHEPDGGSALPDLVKSSTPRFCDEIRHGTTAYSRLFKLVLQNKTFRVYQLINKK